jgi:hypothetical protein
VSVRRRTYAISCRSQWRIPFGAFPSTVAVPRHRGRCPLVVLRWFSFVFQVLPLRLLASAAQSTSRLCSTAESVASFRRFHRSDARCSLGLVVPLEECRTVPAPTRKSGVSGGCLLLPKEKRLSARWERFLRWIRFSDRTSQPCTPPTRLTRCIDAEACRRVHAIPIVRRDGVPLPSAVLRHGPKPVFRAPLARVELTENR